MADISEGQWHDLYLAAKSRMPSYRVEVGQKSFLDTVNTKAALTEGAFGGLPPVIRPEYTQPLPYEPDRIFDHFIGAAMDSQSIEYLVHYGNVNPAAVVGRRGR